MQSLRLALLTAMLIVSGYAVAFAEDAPVPPVYVGPDDDGDDQGDPEQPAIQCEGQNCLPAQANPVQECEGQDCTPAPLIEHVE